MAHRKRRGMAREICLALIAHPEGMTSGAIEMYLEKIGYDYAEPKMVKTRIAQMSMDGFITGEKKVCQCCGYASNVWTITEHGRQGV